MCYRFAWGHMVVLCKLSLKVRNPDMCVLTAYPSKQTMAYMIYKQVMAYWSLIIKKRLDRHLSEMGSNTDLG